LHHLYEINHSSTAAPTVFVSVFLEFHNEFDAGWSDSNSGKHYKKNLTNSHQAAQVVYVMNCKKPTHFEINLNTI
jgi:hypothetical protein